MWTSHRLVADDSIQFNRDIRPILAAACFRCHGVDENSRQGELRLDKSDGALSPAASGALPIIPGKLTQSEVWIRINSQNPDLQMPPPDANRQLKEEEKALIRRWIESGANYQAHWSFEAFSDEAKLSPREKSASAQVDHFIDQAVNSKGLKAYETADKRTLLRRLAFTLTGLPPSRAELEQFLADETSSAYEKMVDHYLASPHHGEEMAKHWLDVARYGDTHGLHLDNERSMWPYRDWVVAAMNRNLPFDQFTIEQLAGDLLPNPSDDQLIATGFNRCNVTTSEGGAINEEFLYRYAVDRASTTIQTWLGITGGCAACHDHKYDPLSTKEFYSLYAFFYSAADPAMDGNVVNTAPFHMLASEQQKRELEQLQSLEQNAWQDLLKIGEHEESMSACDQRVVYRLLDDLEPLGSKVDNGDRYGIGISWKNDDSTIPSGRRCVTQKYGDKVELTISDWLTPTPIPADGMLRFAVKLDALEPSDGFFVELRSPSASKRWGWTDNPEISRDLGVSKNLILGNRPRLGEWTYLEIDLSKHGFKSGDLVTSLKLGQFGGMISWDDFRLIGKSNSEVLRFNDLATWWQHQTGKDTALTDGELRKAIKEGPESEIGRKLHSEVASFHRSIIRSDVGELLQLHRDNYLRTKVSLDTARRSLPGTFVFRDVNPPRQAFVMKRGQYDAPGEPVAPNTPAALPPIQSSEPDKPLTRLDLAKWLVDGNNPIVSRVTVNRFWQQVFGIGLVKTADDFGSQGSTPTHPELLDWLAYHFQSNGWNVKDLMKTLVMTRAFQRQAASDVESYIQDPENRYLARGPRIRLDAEQIRDNVLAVSGLLNRRIGGPGFRGYQPPNIWEPVGYGNSNTRYYIQDHGDVLYRRSIYSFLKRTAPPPFMSNFDAPNRELFCTRRERSNTPLQALQLMNDVQHIEAARVFAERVMQIQHKGVDDRLSWLFEEALSRQPDEAELEELRSAYQSALERFLQRPDDARKLIENGEYPFAKDLPTSELAAMTLIANLVFNLDENVNRN